MGRFLSFFVFLAVGLGAAWCVCHFTTPCYESRCECEVSFGRPAEGGFEETLNTRLAVWQSDLGDALAGAELSQAFELTEKQILYFLMQFRNMDMTKLESQKRVIATFVNSVFVSDDGTITITFNYSSDTNTVTLHELLNADPTGVSGFGCCAEWPTKPRWYEPFVVKNLACIVAPLNRDRP